MFEEQKQICLMVPTYKRHKTYLPQFIDSAISNSILGPDSVLFMFCVNRNDVETAEYLLKRDYNGHQFEIVQETLPKPNLAKFFNMMYAHPLIADNRQCAVTMMGDDMVFRTTGWDDRMLRLMNQYNGVGVFYGNDDFIARERLCVNMFVSRQFVEATEHPFMCEEFDADMIDWIWQKVGKYTRSLHFDPDNHIWHNHNTSKPKEEWDECFQRLRPAQAQGHQIGKDRARQIASKIADILKSKGLTGDNTN